MLRGAQGRREPRLEGPGDTAQTSAPSPGPVAGTPAGTTFGPYMLNHCHPSHPLSSALPAWVPPEPFLTRYPAAPAQAAKCLRWLLMAHPGDTGPAKKVCVSHSVLAETRCTPRPLNSNPDSWGHGQVGCLSPQLYSMG